MKRKGILFFLLAAIVTVWTASHLLGATSFVRSVETQKNAFFYRVTAHLRLKETGEPIPFDVVSSCGYNRIRYKGGDSTLNVARDPYLFAKCVGAEGRHAVMMRYSLRKTPDSKPDGSSGPLSGRVA